MIGDMSQDDQRTIDWSDTRELVGGGDISTAEETEPVDVEQDEADIALGDAWCRGFASGFQRGRTAAREDLRASQAAVDRRASQREWLAQSLLSLAVIAIVVGTTLSIVYG